MSSLWKLITPRNGSTYLRALASPAECRAVASRVPGAKADIAGNVEGALHALLTCLEVSGEKVDWEGERDFGYAGLMGVSDENWESRAGLPVYQRDGSDFIRRRRERGVLCLDDVGVGKQQPIDALVLTPDGYRQMGDIREGDYVIGSNGRPTKVIGVFPQGVKPSYRVTFSDGAFVEAGAEHLWEVIYWRGGKRQERMTVTTEEIHTGAKVGKLSLGKTHLFVPMLSAPVEFRGAGALPLSPYLTGQLIANGALTGTSASVTVNSKDWLTIRDRFLEEGADIGAVSCHGGATRATILDIMPAVRELKLDVLSGQKRIPLTYLRAPIEDRLALLHGLMDGDGSVSATGNRLSYHTTGWGLAQDVRELVEQLGGTAKVHEYERDGGKPTEYHVRIRLPSFISPFSVPRKARRYKPGRHAHPTRSFKSIEYVRDVKSVCIKVAAPDQLYATDHAIVTHNTVQTIAALALDTEHVHVVLCPASLRTQWAEEIKRWTKALMNEEQAVHVVFPAGDKRSRIPPPENLQWVVAFYLDSDRVAEVVRRARYDLVIDEVHNFKRLKSQRQTAIRKLASFAGGRVGLTASPLHNDVERFYPVLDLISPWAWGARNDFLVRYASGKDTGYGVEAGKLSHVEELRNRLSLVSFRRTREDLGTQLPFSTRYSMVWIEAPPRASLVERLRADAHGDGVSHLEWVAVNYKVTPVVEAVTSDLDAGRGALVLTYLRAHAQALHKALPGSLLCMGGTGDNGARAREYLGSCASRGVTPCIVGTLAAIGEGGNLQALKSVNIAAVSHTPEEMRQAVGRVARHGQTGEVPVRIFGCKGTLDERFCAIALDKLAEQAKLDGRKEKSKADLKETLSPSMNKDRARELLERLMKEERQ